MEVINCRIVMLIEKINKSQKKQRRYYWLGIVVLVIIILMEAVLIFLIPNIDGSRVYIDSLSTAITSIVIGISIPMVVAYVSMINDCERQISEFEKDIYALGESLYISGTLSKDNQKYFEENIIKIK